MHLHRPSVILHRNLQHERIIHIIVNHHNIVINLPKLVSLIIRNLKHQDDFPIRHVGQNNSCLKSNTFYFFGWRKIGCKKMWKNKVSELHRPTYSVWLLVCRYNYTPTTYVGVCVVLARLCFRSNCIHLYHHMLKKDCCWLLLYTEQRRKCAYFVCARTMFNCFFRNH